MFAEVLDMEDDLEPVAAPIDSFVSHSLKYTITTAALGRVREKEI